MLHPDTDEACNFVDNWTQYIKSTYSRHDCELRIEDRWTMSSATLWQCTERSTTNKQSKSCLFLCWVWISCSLADVESIKSTKATSSCPTFTTTFFTWTLSACMIRNNIIPTVPLVSRGMKLLTMLCNSSKSVSSGITQMLHFPAFKVLPF